MLRNTFKLLSISTLAILLAGCKVGAPLNQSVMMSHKPTVNQSAKRVSVHAGISAYHNNMLIVDGMRTEAHNDDQLIVDRQTDIEFMNMYSVYGLNLRILDNMEFILEGKDYGGKGSIKYQLPSDNMFDGNFVHAVVVGFERLQNSGTHVNEYLGELADTSDFAQQDLKFKNEVTAYEFAYVAGYKVTDSVLVYGGPFYQSANIKGYQEAEKTEFTSDSPILNNDGVFNLDFVTKTKGINLGVSSGLTEQWVFSLEFQGYEMDILDEQQSDRKLTFKVEYQFD